MPFIISKVSCEIKKEQETELKQKMGKAIELTKGTMDTTISARR